MSVLEWVRLPNDALFILSAALPLVWMSWQALRYPNTAGTTPDADVRVQLFPAGVDEAAPNA